MPYTPDPSDRPATRLAHEFDDYPHRGVVAPVYQNSLFTFPDFEAFEAATGPDSDGSFVYSRGNNPTVAALEKKVAALEGTDAARGFGSGMGAISSAVLSNLKAGDHVICIRAIYGVTRRLLEDFLPRFGVTHSWVPSNPSESELEVARRPETTVLMLESPSSVIFELQDLRMCTAWARRHGITTVIDNSWASPLFQNPHALGVDLVCHTASKYLGGHSDLVAGMLSGPGERVHAINVGEYAILGSVLHPWDAWLIMRGLRTLEVRLRQHEQNALGIARWLETRPEVKRVFHPALDSHPQHALFKTQMRGSSGLFSIELDFDEPRVRRFINALRLFGIAVSWGGFESLALPIGIMMNRDAPNPDVPRGLVRLHIGLEDVHDLQRDLELALETV
jgi:cystathionine beta-lyase